MAMESAQITAEVIEANEFQDLSAKARVRGVPKTMVLGGATPLEFVGAQPEEIQVAHVLEAAGIDTD